MSLGFERGEWPMSEDEERCDCDGFGEAMNDRRLDFADFEALISLSTLETFCQ